MTADADILYQDTLPGDKHWSFTLRRGLTLRLIDLEGGANVGMLFYNPINMLERYNAPDTLKCQHTFKLTAGHCLYSDMGRIFCSIPTDSVGWHDTVGGVSTRKSIDAKWGLKDYQTHRNEWTQSGQDSFLVEAAKYGLGKRDMAANVNWFSRIATDDNGNMRYVAGNSKAGDFVDIRFEMDTLVLMHTCAHPLNTATEYPVKPVRYELRPAAPVKADDLCRTSRPENQRGFANTELYNTCAPVSRALPQG